MRRVFNVKVMLCSIVLLLISGLAVHLLHRVQVGRSGRNNYDDALRFEAEGDYENAARLMKLYVAYEPGDLNALEKYGDLIGKLATKPIEKHESFLVYEQVLSRDPKREALRRKVVERAQELRLNAEAVRHLDFLAQAHPEEAGIQAAMGTCYEALGKFDAAAFRYQQALKNDPHLSVVYLKYAALADKHPSKERNVETILDQYVENNPESIKARLERGLRKVTTDIPAAARDIERAGEIAPENADVLSAMIKLARARQENVPARATLKKAMKLYPKDERFYMEMARLDQNEGQREAAEKVLVQGIAVAEKVDELQWMLANQYFDMGRANEAETLVAGLRNKDAPPSALMMLDARREMLKENWSEAVKNLKGVVERFRGGKMPVDILNSTNLYLGRCYDQLGDFPQSERAYRAVIEADPGSITAQLGLAGALSELGRKDEAMDLYRSLVSKVPSVRLAIARIAIENNPRLPKEKRLWRPIESLLDTLEKEKPNSMEVALTQAVVLMAQDRATVAEERVLALKKSDPNRSEPWLFEAENRLKQGKVDEVLPLLDAARVALGDRVEFRVARANFWATSGGPNALKDLKSLEADASKFNVRDQRRLLNQVSNAYERLGSLADASRLWLRLMELDPDACDVMVTLLQYAINTGDRTLAAKSTAAITKSNGPEGPYTTFAAALPLLAEVKRGALGKVKEVRALLQNAAATKPGWAPPLLAIAELSVASGEREQVIKNLVAAIDAGVRDPEVVRKAINLLYATRRFDEAERLLDSLGRAASLPGSLRRTANGLSLRNEPLENVITSARRVVEKGSTDPADYVWLAQLLAAAKQSDEIVPLFRKAIALDETRPETWFELTAFLVRNGRDDEAKKVVAEARPKLLAAKQEIVLATCYEMTGATDLAEALFRDAMKSAPDDPALLRTFAEFCIRRGKVAESETALKQLWRLGAKAPSQASWARRVLLIRDCLGADAATTERAIMEFQKESQQNAEREDDLMSDQRAVGFVLASQPARPRRKEAISLLQGVVDRNYSSAEDEFLLAQLYDEQGEARRAMELIDRLILQQRDNPRYLTFRARMLIRQGQIVLAQGDVAKLKEKGSGDFTTAELDARLLNASGKPEEAVSLLQKVSADQPQKVRLRAVSVLEQLGGGQALDAAESMLRAAGDAPDPPAILLEYSTFLARRGKLDQAIGVWVKAREKCTKALTANAALILAQSAGITADQLEALASWLEKAVKSEPKSALLASDLGVLREKQRRYEDAEALYRQAIKADPRSVVALNNLGCLLAIRGGRGEEALDLANRAIAVSGPMPALLDTRALALLSLGRNDTAIKDLETALELTPTSNRLFHQARALLMNGDRNASIQAYDKAIKAGLKSESLHPLERPRLDELVAAFRRR